MVHLKMFVALTAATALLPLSHSTGKWEAAASAPSSPLDCSEVRNAFTARGIRVDWSSIPAGPMDGEFVEVNVPCREQSSRLAKRYKTPFLASHLLRKAVASCD